MDCSEGLRKKKVDVDGWSESLELERTNQKYGKPLDQAIKIEGVIVWLVDSSRFGLVVSPLGTNL